MIDFRSKKSRSIIAVPTVDSLFKVAIIDSAARVRESRKTPIYLWDRFVRSCFLLEYIEAMIFGNEYSAMNAALSPAATSPEV